MCSRSTCWSASPATDSSPAYKHEGFWQCMDTLRDKQGLERLWLAGTPPWKRW